MEDLKRYASYAVMMEVNAREFRRRIALFPEELRYYVILANGIVGTENAKRVGKTPEGVARDGGEFVEKLRSLGPDPDEAFKDVLEKLLIESMQDELRRCCPNCLGFEDCLNLDPAEVGVLFRRRVEGDDTGEVRGEIAGILSHAFLNTPHMEGDEAHERCPRFRHAYSASSIGEMFNRYADIAAALRQPYGVDYRKIQSAMVSLNMKFAGSGERGAAGQ